LYVYYLLQTELDKIHKDTYAVTVKHISSSQIKKIKIPLPPIEVQREIVAEINRYQKIIDGARQVVENYKPSFKIDPEWERLKIREIGAVRMCKRIFKHQTKTKGDVPFFKIGTFGKEPDAYIDRELFENFKSDFPYPKKGSILISTSGTIGRTVVFDGKPSYFQDSNIVWIENNEKKVTNSYLHLVFQSIKWVPEKGGIIERLYNKIIEDTEILVPPLETQQVIVDQIHSESGLIKSNIEVVALFEQKIQDKISEVWGD
jgi:type I restriction enzyme S subunit